MFIMDVLRYDMETLPLILQLLNLRDSIGWRFAWSGDFEEGEVAEAIGRLRAKGDVVLLTPNGHSLEIDNDSGVVDLLAGSPEIWVELTESGRDRWERWEDFPVEHEETS
ncbi:MAG: hypothetical protein WD359_02380 [Dehalococcoidia bacterium]